MLAAGQPALGYVDKCSIDPPGRPGGSILNISRARNGQIFPRIFLVLNLNLCGFGSPKIRQILVPLKNAIRVSVFVMNISENFEILLEQICSFAP